MNKFYTKAGWLTRYALSCGYIHRQELSAEATVKLELCSGGTYVVEKFDWNASGVKDSQGQNLRAGLAYYEHFESIEQARKEYTRLVSKLKYRFENAGDMKQNVIV